MEMNIQKDCHMDDFARGKSQLVNIPVFQVYSLFSVLVFLYAVSQ